MRGEIIEELEARDEKQRRARVTSPALDLHGKSFLIDILLHFYCLFISSSHGKTDIPFASES